MFLIIVVLAVVAVASVVAAFLLGSGGGARSVAPAKSQENDPQINACQAACTQLITRHAQRCDTEADERTAHSTADARRTELNTALTVAGSLLAGAIAAAALALVGWVVAGPIFAAAAAASLAAAYIGGLLSRADANLAAAEQASHDARTRETEARIAVSEHCSIADASACFAGLAPCS